MTAKVPKPAYCVSPLGELREFGRFPDPDAAAEFAPPGTYFCSLATLREIASGRLGFLSLGGVTSLRLAVEAGRITGRGMVRNSLETALQIVESRFDKRATFPVIVETDPKKLAAELMQRINFGTVPVTAAAGIAEKFFPGLSPEICDAVVAEIERTLGN